MMDNIIDYVKWVGRFPFQELPFCEVDALVLCQISYFDFRLFGENDRRTLSLKERFDAFVSERNTYPHIEGAKQKNTLEFIKEAAYSTRFGDLTVADYTEVLNHKKAIQFAAMTFDCKNDLRFIAFRGTDDTLAGWKEDFMISFTETAAQKLALEYAQKHICPGVKNYIGGHSKGGNLALYASSLLDWQRWDNVEQVYILDGPGLCGDVMDTGLVERVNRRATRVIPEFSIIGRLFEPKIKNTLIVNSSESGLNQHGMLSWGVKYGKLDTVKSTNPKADHINETVAQWIENVSQQERREFVGDFFHHLSEDGSLTVSDVAAKGVDSLENLVVKMLGASSAGTKKTIGSLSVRAAFGNIFHGIGELGFLKWLGQCYVAKAVLMIVFGIFFLFASKNILNIAAVAFFVILAAAELAFTIKRLYKSHWNFGIMTERIYICIVLTAIILVLFVKENAMFMIGSIVFGILAFIIAFQSISKSADKTSSKFLRIVHALEAVFCFIYGASFLVIPEATVYAYGISIGIALIVDGLLRLGYKVIPIIKSKIK